jgi:hypothetical protein
VPAGEYEVRAWHYAQAAPITPERARLGADGRAPATFTVTLKPMMPRIAPR